MAGAMPTAWFPSAIARDSDGALRVLNLKGTGNTSRQKALQLPPVRRFAVHIPAPQPAQIEGHT